MKASPRAGIRAGLTTALVVFGLSAVAPARAQDPFKSALPDTTLFYIGAPNIERWFEGFKNSAAYKIWAEEEVQEFLADLMAEGSKHFEQGMAMAKQMHESGQLPIDPAKLLQIRMNGFSVALTDLQMPSQDGPAKASLIACVDFGKSSKVVEEALGILVQMGAAQAGDWLQIEKSDVGGNTLNVVKAPGQAAQMAPTLGLAWGFVGGRLLIGTDTQRCTEIMGALGGKAVAKPLIADETYSRVAQRVDARHSDLEVFCRPAAMIDVAMSGLRFAANMEPDLQEVDMDGIDRAVDTLGLKGLEAWGMTSGYNGSTGFFKSFLKSDRDSRKGFLTLGAKQPVNMEHLTWIPKDVGAFSIANIGNLEGIYTTLMDAANAYDEGVGKLVTEKLRGVEEALGLNLRKDLFGAFGNELISYSMPVTGLMATPEFVFMLGCKNPDRTLEVINKLCGLSNGRVAVQESKADEGTYYTIDLALEDTGMGMDPTGMLDPTFAFKNGFLIFGMSRSDVKGAIKRFAGAGKDVRENPAFKPYVQSIPGEIQSLSFTDVAASVDGIYSMLSGVLGMVPMPADVPIDLGLLPSVDTLTKHLFGSVTWGRSSKDGFYGQNVGPFGPEMVIAGGALVAGGLGAVGFMAAREQQVKVRRVGK